MTNESREYEAPGQPEPVQERIRRIAHVLVTDAGYGRHGTWHAGILEAIKAGVQIAYDEVIAAGEFNSEACKQVAKVYREIEQEQLRWMGPDPMAKVRDEMMGAIWAAFEFTGEPAPSGVKQKVATWLRSVYGEGFGVGTVTQEKRAEIEKEDLRRNAVARVDTGNGTARVRLDPSFVAGQSASSSTPDAVLEDVLATARHAVKVGNSSLLDVTAARLGQILLEHQKRKSESGGGR